MTMTDLIKAAAKKQQDSKRYSSSSISKSVTYSGGVIDILSPTPKDIRIEDIADALSKICRFAGNSLHFYSVAQHCCLVHDLCDLEHRPWALLHDAHEAYMGDIPQPVKSAAHVLGGGYALDLIASRLDTAIAAAFGLQWPQPEEGMRQIKHFDAVALATERYQVLGQAAAHSSIWSKEQPRPRMGMLQRAWKWQDALDQFMARFDALNLTHTTGA